MPIAPTQFEDYQYLLIGSVLCVNLKQMTVRGCNIPHYCLTPKHSALKCIANDSNLRCGHAIITAPVLKNLHEPVAWGRATTLKGSFEVGIPFLMKYKNKRSLSVV